MLKKLFFLLPVLAVQACSEVPEVIDGALPLPLEVDEADTHEAAILDTGALGEKIDSTISIATVLASDAEVKEAWETQVGRFDPPPVVDGLVNAPSKNTQSIDVSAPVLETEATGNFDHSAFNALLKKHVSTAGKVNYSGFKDNAAFQGYLDKLSTQPPRDSWPKQERMVYWINAYNAFTVKLIIDNMPLESIKDVGSPWKKKFFKIDGKDFDLNTIEHEILRKQFNEPRIHFAINCASASCPKLLNATFELATLEAQLQQAAVTFVNDPSKNSISSDEVRLSKIFNWFESDFTTSGVSIIDYINKYAKTKANEDAKVRYLDYDWSLNDK